MLAKEQTMINGMPVERLRETIQAIGKQPELGCYQFRTLNRWMGGCHNRSRVKEFYGAGQEDHIRTEPFVLDNDEPQVLCGEDQAPNPMEYLLHALAGCLTTAMVSHAAARGIEIESVESSLEGDIDVRGFLGLSDDVPRGCKAIRARLRVKSEASAAKLEELCKLSPVYNSLVNPVPVEIIIEKT